jgi:transcriptional regulator with XRE-family HTH domain
MDHREFSQRLTEVRHQLGWTYDDIANITGISRRMAAAYELGDTPPSFKFLMALMAAGVDIMYLITGQAQDSVATKSTHAEPFDGAKRLLAAMQPLPPPVQSPNEITFLSGFRELGPRDQRKMLQMLWRLQHKEEGT